MPRSAVTTLRIALVLLFRVELRGLIIASKDRPKGKVHRDRRGILSHVRVLLKKRCYYLSGLTIV